MDKRKRGGAAPRDHPTAHATVRRVTAPQAKVTIGGQDVSDNGRGVPSQIHHKMNKPCYSQSHNNKYRLARMEKDP